MLTSSFISSRNTFPVEIVKNLSSPGPDDASSMKGLFRSGGIGFALLMTKLSLPLLRYAGNSFNSAGDDVFHSSSFY